MQTGSALCSCNARFHGYTDRRALPSVKCLSIPEDKYHYDKERWALPSIFVTRRFTVTLAEGLCPLLSTCVFRDGDGQSNMCRWARLFAHTMRFFMATVTEGLCPPFSGLVFQNTSGNATKKDGLCPLSLRREGLQLQ